MNETNVIKFIRLMGYDDSAMVIRDDWVNILCPLLDSKHKQGQRSLSHPSAGISINPTGRSYFKCFSCTPENITLLNLIVRKNLEGKLSDPTLSLFYQKHEIYPKGEEELEEDSLFSEQRSDGPFKFNKWVLPTNEEVKEDRLPKFPDELLGYFPTLSDATDVVAMKMKDYLVNFRNISMGTLADMGIRYNKNKNLIIFPLTDKRGDIQVLRARLCDPSIKTMYTIASKAFKDKYNLPNIRDTGASFGLHKLDNTKPAIIVESETDCLLLKTYGFNNVIATTSASFSKSQIHNVCSPNLWIGFDNDDAGRRATKNLIAVSNGKLVHVINWGNAGGKDPGDADNRLDIARAINKKILVEKNKSLTKNKFYGIGRKY